MMMAVTVAFAWTSPFAIPTASGVDFAATVPSASMNTTGEFGTSVPGVDGSNSVTVTGPWFGASGAPSIGFVASGVCRNVAGSHAPTAAINRNTEPRRDMVFVITSQ